MTCVLPLHWALGSRKRILETYGAGGQHLWPLEIAAAVLLDFRCQPHVVGSQSLSDRDRHQVWEYQLQLSAESAQGY